ncbi:MAG: hypothetical protein RLZZ122_646 [Actinomycetota bacterium]|jgi:predicted RNA-binding protein YlqC (UPF0109 family)
MLQATLQHIVRAIVDHPDDATVASRNNGRGDLLEIRVHPDDLGRVIGKGGKTATSLRTLINSLADGKRVRIDVVDTDF